MPRIFTNGCFDILHIQHIMLLTHCRGLAGPDGKVTVGLNSDRSVRALKGEGRPIMKQSDRFMLLMHLNEVDEVFVFDEDTPYKLIYDLQPDIIVKGSDWKHRYAEVAGYDLVPKGNLRFAPTDDSITTSKIIERIQAEYKSCLVDPCQHRSPPAIGGKLLGRNK